MRLIRHEDARDTACRCADETRPKRRTTPMSRWAWVCCVVLALGVTACGSGDDASETSAASASSGDPASFQRAIRGGWSAPCSSATARGPGGGQTIYKTVEQSLTDEEMTTHVVTSSDAACTTPMMAL